MNPSVATAVLASMTAVLLITALLARRAKNESRDIRLLLATG